MWVVKVPTHEDHMSTHGEMPRGVRGDAAATPLRVVSENCPWREDRPRRQDAIDLSFSGGKQRGGVYAALTSTRFAGVSGTTGTVMLSIPF